MSVVCGGGTGRMGQDGDVTSCTIRHATETDVSTVVALEERCLGQDAWGEGLVRAGILGEVPTVTYLVAEMDGEVVGHAVCSGAGDIAELQRIAVAEERRHQGVATALLAEAVLTTADTADRMLLEVRADNRAALGFYAREGFVEIDHRPRYYADGTDAVVLRRSLGRGCGASTTAPA